MTTTEAPGAATTQERIALDRARALARAIGATAAFRKLEAAQEAIDADSELRLRIGEFNVREQELRSARAWGGADPNDESALEREWQDLASHPVLAAHLAARQELGDALRRGRGGDQRRSRSRLQGGVRSFEGLLRLVQDLEREMAEASGDGRGIVNEGVRGLVEALRATPTLARFRVALDRFRTDEELGRMQAELRASHERLQQAEREKRHDPQIFKEVRELQAQLQEHPLVLEFVAAREAVAGSPARWRIRR